MATKKKADEAINEQFDPPEADHLEPEVEIPEPQKKLHGVFRFMGGVLPGVDYYGMWFPHGEWVEVYDPFIAQKARGNADFDTQGKNEENKQKQAKREAREPNRMAYIKEQERRRRRANRNADEVLGE